MSDKIAFRQWRQDFRIDNGVRSGALTAEEAHELRQGQREIRQAVQEARADGHVDVGERQAIRDLQDGASCDIYELKHNEAQRPDLVLHFPVDNPNPGPILQGPIDLSPGSEPHDSERPGNQLETLVRSARLDSVRA